jgi:hypothetical protein
MPQFFILFRSLVNPDTGDELTESAVQPAATQAEAVELFNKQMAGCDFEIISVHPFTEPVL